MELHQLRYFVEVARQKNFSRAAERCYVAQPSLSQQLKKLEEELGQPLFLRTRMGAQLTAFGEELFPKALELLSGVSDIIETASAQNEAFSGRVVLGAIPTMAPYLLPRLLEELGKRYPEMRLQIIEDTTDRLLGRFREGLLDFAFLSPPFEGDELLVAERLFEDELFVVLSSDHPLANQPAIDLGQLEDERLVVLKDVHCLGRQSVAVCESLGLKASVELESAQLETVVALVRAGAGFSIVPAIARNQIQTKGLAFCSLLPAAVSRSVVLCHPRRLILSETQKAFGLLVQEIFGDE